MLDFLFSRRRERFSATLFIGHTPNFRMCGLFVHFAATDVHRLVTAVTAVVPVIHAPHVTASPVKSSIDIHRLITAVVPVMHAPHVTANPVKSWIDQRGVRLCMRHT
jgi:hypothetical protein